MKIRFVMIHAIVLAFCGTLLSSPAWALPGLKISDNHHFIVTTEGKPFFWLGDTAWELFHRLDRAAAEVYLKDRAAKGYNVVQAVVLAELKGLSDPNPEGHLPLLNNDPLKPNEDYFKHVDFIVQKANALGLYVGMLPTWGDKYNKKWGAGPEVFTPQNAEFFGKWLATRYKDAGLVWILGGDRPFENDKHKAIIRAMAKGLREGDGGAHLITVHPMGGASSADTFHKDAWLDFNMRQNGHVAEYTERYRKTKLDYDLEPAKPIIDSEPIYEDHPVSFKANELGISIAADVRRPLYWDLFSGACGHTYGHHSVWQMFAPGREPINNPLMPWGQAIKQPGAGQMQYGRWLMESRPFMTRIPDDTIIIADKVVTAMPGAGRYRFVATRDTEGTYAMVYAPVGRSFRVRLDAVKAKNITAWWFDPRTGKARQAGKFKGEGEQMFSPPNMGEHLDWVLVLDDASKRYAAPGARRGKL